MCLCEGSYWLLIADFWFLISDFWPLFVSACKDTKIFSHLQIFAQKSNYSDDNSTFLRSLCTNLHSGFANVIIFSYLWSEILNHCYGKSCFKEIRHARRKGCCIWKMDSSARGVGSTRSATRNRVGDCMKLSAERINCTSPYWVIQLDEITFRFKSD